MKIVADAGCRYDDVFTVNLDKLQPLAYARHAVKAGVRIKTIVYRGLGHGFADQIGVMPQGEDLMSEIADMMREVL